MAAWVFMQNAQNTYRLNNRLIRVVTRLHDFGEEDTVESLIAQGYYCKAIQAKYSDLLFFKLKCVHVGADVNCPYEMMLALHCACMISDAETAELLISYGAQVLYF